MADRKAASGRLRPLWLAAALLSTGVAAAGAMAAEPDPHLLRVCADPNNLPFSDRQGNGFENKLAELVAAELGKEVSYTWWAQRRGFVRNTLKAGDCDLVMGVPAGFEMVDTTRPYYRSTYVFVSRADRRLDLSSIRDPRLRKLSIGVQLVGDDGANTPPVHALGREGIVDNLVGYSVFGDYGEAAPPARVVRAVEDGTVDIAAVWGPLAGYFAKHAAVPMTVVPIADTEGFAPLQFRFAIAMGVRKGDDALRTRLDEVIARKRPEIEALLREYGVPLLAIEQADARPTGERGDAD